MRSPLLVTLVLATSVSACGFSSSKLNPFNWFGKSEEVTTLEPEEGYAKAKGDFRVPVAQVTALDVKQTLSGAIISATGLQPTQGWWDAELIAKNGGTPEDGVLTYRFVIAEPDPLAPAATRVSTPQSREVTVATYITRTKLEGVRSIVVEGAANARSVRR
ncbi:hypothetical protein RYZ20_00835 [Thioclava sp. A2]|uniref:hypothetical protein n=1 Tax=Thioclava sp. FCG-A2 TaxID=3080562 RepID=UPI0029541697|nr:hypothetical protein [Thioclava sp. A2]MDV7269440.1 hypothetical protein [Thioclava sp. A2]